MCMNKMTSLVYPPKLPKHLQTTCRNGMGVGMSHAEKLLSAFQLDLGLGNIPPRTVMDFRPHCQLKLNLMKKLFS